MEILEKSYTSYLLGRIYGLLCSGLNPNKNIILDMKDEI